MESHTQSREDILNAFRSHYYRITDLVESAIRDSADTFALSAIGSQLDEYALLITQVSL